MSIALDAFGPGLRRPMPPGRMERIAQRDPAMRARSDAGIVAIAPVGEVVAALATGSGEIADFVGEQPMVGANRLRLFVEGGRCIIVGQRDLAPAMHALEHRAGLDGELIKRKVVGAEPERAVELGPPGR